MQCLSKLDSYRLYNEHKLKLTGRQTLKPAKEAGQDFNLGANNDLKITADFQTGKYRPKNDRQQTGQTDSKTLITDLDSGTLTNNPNRPENFKMQTVNKASKKGLKGSQKH